ncbi:hypothetical protein B0H63DRAFT_450967 [Podospora didyma]|uniref:F-box domain-containing protein n=1 Tax=Podospora didyma TaxID=330526 RepID=A0AAE0TW39_9PEZI|nr:hypothetical protein B0H63DRAFT_450967 [Podospora didyma]
MSKPGLATLALPKMPLGAYPPEIFRMPDYMCWLCRREIEVSSHHHLGGHSSSRNRAAYCRVVTFSHELLHGVDASVAISGVGYRAAREDTAPSGLSFVVPHQYDQSVEDYGATISAWDRLDVISDPVYNTCTEVGRRVWSFRVHADCWGMVELRTDDVAGCVVLWSKAMVCLNWNFAPFTLGPRHYDLPRLLLASTTPYKKNHRRTSLQRLETHAGLAAELGLVKPSSSPGEPAPLSRFDHLYLPSLDSLAFVAGGSDIFSNLPEEVLQHILRFTRTADLVNFRLASRAVAYVSRLTALPKSFWFSRFLPSFELGFALPEKIDRSQDWRALYFLTRDVLRQTAAPKSQKQPDSMVARLAKRKYCWERLAEIPALPSVWGSGRPLAGSPFSSPPLPPPPTDSTGDPGNGNEHIQNLLKSKDCIASSRLKRDDGTERHYASVCMPLPSSSVSAIGVSTVKLGGQVYVSGLRVWSREPSGAVAESLGYALEQTETVVALEPGEHFLGLGVRLDADAIRALKVVIRVPSGKSRASNWIGDNTGGELIAGHASKELRGELELLHARGEV